MTLGTLIESLEENQHIRLGAVDGSGYYYIGTAGNCDLEKVGVRILADMFVTLNNNANLYMRKRKKEWSEVEDDRVKQALHKTIDRFGAFTPLYDREVVSLSWIESEDDCLKILADGIERGRYRNEAEVSDDGKPIGLCRQGAQALVEAVYRGVANELKENLRATKSINPRTADRARDKAERLKKYFRYDPYGILTDSEAVIEACIRACDMEGAR